MGNGTQFFFPLLSFYGKMVFFHDSVWSSH